MVKECHVTLLNYKIFKIHSDSDDFSLIIFYEKKIVIIKMVNLIGIRKQSLRMCFLEKPITHTSRNLSKLIFLIRRLRCRHVYCLSFNTHMCVNHKTYFPSGVATIFNLTFDFFRFKLDTSYFLFNTNEFN